MRKILLQLFCIACTLNVMAQNGKNNDNDHYLNQTTLQVTKAGTLEQAFADAKPDNYQGLCVVGPLNEADMRFLVEKKICTVLTYKRHSWNVFLPTGCRALPT